MIFTQKQIGIRNLQGCRLKKLHQGATSPDSTPKDAYNIVVKMINVQILAHGGTDGDFVGLEFNTVLHPSNCSLFIP